MEFYIWEGRLCIITFCSDSIHALNHAYLQRIFFKGGGGFHEMADTLGVDYFYVFNLWIDSGYNSNINI